MRSPFCRINCRIVVLSYCRMKRCLVGGVVEAELFSSTVVLVVDILIEAVVRVRMCVCVCG